jgi:hypothetical protein
MAKTAAQDEFVDLYEILEIAENTDTEQIRKRVNVLYLDAQQNLDHRNVKKRLQYQQMYEIYLPQARHLLLDSRRRAEYDRYLQAWRTGAKVEAVEEVPVAARPTGDLPGAPGKISDHDLPEIVEQEVDPEKLAAEREEMWAKWKTGLEIASEQSPDDTLPVSTIQSSAPTTSPQAARQRSVPAASSAKPRQAPRPAVPRFNPNRPPQSARPTPRIGGAVAGSEAPDESIKLQEKQREQQRFQLIKTSVQNAGLIWGLGIGAVIFVIGCVILFTLDNALKPPPFQLSRPAFALLGFVVVVIFSALGGMYARKNAKRRMVAELSPLSLEELLRRGR